MIGCATKSVPRVVLGFSWRLEQFCLGDVVGGYNYPALVPSDDWCLAVVSDYLGTPNNIISFWGHSFDLTEGSPPRGVCDLVLATYD